MKNVAVITGASRGLGLELALRMASKGYFIIGVHRGLNPDEKWLELLAEQRAIDVKGDVKVEQTCALALREANDRGTISMLINAAGVGYFGPPGALETAQIEEVIGCNLVGTVLFCERFYKWLPPESFIINISSVAALTGRHNEAVYCASKWGVRGYTEALQGHAKERGIKVLAVYPGGMKTSFWASDINHVSSYSDPGSVARTILGVIELAHPELVTSLIIGHPPS